VPRTNWFALCGTIDDEEKNLFHIGLGDTITADRDGYLYLFANDLKQKYGNNEGAIVVTITRIV